MHSDRLRRLRKAIRGKDLDALLITNPNDIRYLTGFSGEDSFALCAPRKLVIISDSRFEEELAPLSGEATIVIRRDKRLTEETGRLVEAMKLDTLAIQAEHVTVQTRDALAKAVGAKKLRKTVGLVSKLRAKKDEAEVRLIREAIRIQQEALRAALEWFTPGVTESRFAAYLEYEMKSRGADGAAFRSIVAGKANGSKPHYNPSPKVKITKNQPLLIDWGARVGGYCGDLTRTFAVGKMPSRIREIYGIVLEAQKKAIDAIRPGVACRTIDEVARDHITSAGYGEAFGHGLGHGLGLDVHESPGLSKRAAKDDLLEAGMVVTVEPGIYLPGVGGVRIEDDVLVTEKGRRVLSDFPKEIDSAIIG
ncbi:MAG: M24 family metallopeptidase [Phycisphaerales bacterium]